MGLGTMSLVKQIEQAFGSEPLPSKDQLVRFDGFDELGKEFLVTHLSGKTQNEVLCLLREGEFGNGSTITEELELAEPVAIRYYLKPFLVHFVESISAKPHALDDEVPFFLFAHIRNILAHRGKHIFTDSQIGTISAVVNESRKLLLSLPDGTWLKDVAEELARVYEALQRD